MKADLSERSGLDRENVKRAVRQLGAYTLRATEAPVKLNQNEAPWDFPAERKARILERVAAQAWNRYPDFYPVDVLEGLGALHGLGAEHVLLGNGSNELIQALLAAVVGEGDAVAIPQPTFTLYAMMVEANGGTVRHIALRPDLSHDLEAWQREADANEAHLLVCSPNNPTGSTLSVEEIADLCRRTRRLVIVDEAYAQFGPQDMTPLLQRHGNLVLLRTFSKAAGLAAVRLGYALAHEALVREVGKVKLPYNVGIFGLEVAREVLADPAIIEEAAGKLRTERERLTRALVDLPGLEVRTGLANFVLVRSPDAARIFDGLLAEGILVRDVGRYPMLEHTLRISVGRPEQNDVLIARLGVLLGGAQPAQEEKP